MSNSFKECPSTNNSSVHEPSRSSPIKKLKAKRKILRIQTVLQFERNNIPKSAIVFPNLTQKIYLGVGNLEWVLWPMRKEKNSRSLFLNFAGVHMRPNEMQDDTFCVPFLRLPLTTIKSLADLRIDLTDCKSITEKTLWLIFSRLKHIQSLEYLEVCLKQNENLTHSGIQYIAIFAKNLRSLKGFYFGRSEASSTQAQGLNMTTLVGINIANHIYQGFKLDDRSLILISPAIRVMKSLTNLTLNLLDTKTTDTGLIPLFKALTHLDQLQFFTLILCTSNIGDLGLIQLAQVLPNFRSLQGLVIDFGMCHQITESGIASLMSSIQKLEELTDLFLSFYCCHKVNDKVVSIIATALELKELNYLVLDLAGCNINNAQSLLEEATEHIQDKQIRTGRVW